MKITKEFKTKWFYLIVPGLITTALWELLKYICKKLPETGNSIIKEIVNLPYKRAAVPMLDIIFVAILVGVFCIPLFLKFADLIKGIRLLQRANTLGKEKVENTSQPPISKTKRSRSEDIAEIKKDIKRLIVRLALSAIMSVALFAYIIMTIISPLVLRSTFLHNIDIITPYTDQKTIQMLKSDWARMNTKEDYEKIDATILHIRETNNLIEN